MESSKLYEDLLESQRKERKEIIAKTQKMKHGVPKGDKKKKKEVTTEITQILADLDLKHEEELKQFQVQHASHSNVKSEADFQEKPASSLSDVEAPKSEENGQHVLFSNGTSNTKFSNGTSNTEFSNGTSNTEFSNGLHGEKHFSTSTDGEASCSPENNCEDTSEKHVHKLSKAQKRRNKKAQQAKEREKAIAEQEIDNLSGLRHMESVEMNKKLQERKLTIYEVPSDGNCLYKAIEHQLSSLNIKQTTVKELREETSKYLLAHKDDFLPFITHPETGDVLSDDQFQKYCNDIASTTVWGGHIEIKALSCISERRVEVIQAFAPSIFIGEENATPELIICYHRHMYGLGEHYNSVIPICLQ